MPDEPVRIAPAYRFTRRRFGALIRGAAFASAGRAFAQSQDPDYTLVVVPDPQFLTNCGALYRSLMNWVLDNQAAAGSLGLNIKAVIGVGDCVNTPNTAEADAARQGWALLDANGFPWITPPGNHDMVGGDNLGGRVLAANFQPRGFFAADQRAAQRYWGSPLPGGHGSSAWGGSFDSANCYIRFNIGARKLLVLSLEFQPRTAVLLWARGIHDAWLDHECILTTHSYLTDSGDLGSYRSDPSINQYNNDEYQIGGPPFSNSGYQMWNGSAGAPAWPGLSGWSNLTMILCGHFVYGGWHNSGPVKARRWQRMSAASNSLRKQEVHQVFCNWQDMEATPADYCSGGPDRKNDAGHLFLLRFRPSLGTLEGYGLSVNNGLWCDGPAGAAIAPAPVRLFSVPYPGNVCHPAQLRSRLPGESPRPVMRCGPEEIVR